MTHNRTTQSHHTITSHNHITNTHMTHNHVTQQTTHNHITYDTTYDTQSHYTMTSQRLYDTTHRSADTYATQRVSRVEDGMCYTHTGCYVSHAHAPHKVPVRRHICVRHTTHCNTHICVRDTRMTQGTGPQTHRRRMRCRERRMGCVASWTDSALLSATHFMM